MKSPAFAGLLSSGAGFEPATCGSGARATEARTPGCPPCEAAGSPGAAMAGMCRAGPRQGQSPALAPGQRRRRRRLVTILREHIEEFGTATDGRLFRTATGGMVCDTTHTWAAARTLALARSRLPLCSRPGPTTYVMLRSRYGRTAGSRPQRWRIVQVTVWRCCCGCTPCASTAARRPLTRGSKKHWPSDRSTRQRSRFRRGPFCFMRLTWGNASSSIRDQRQVTAVGCI